ncbi:putative invertase inhibitor [Triticum dicoccoides]|uniref:putative invertase inhibitor n=1 Tax=Triticum dicoccoides TaxID=85692 RepID=UPI00188F1AC7|nr:putative invertase inhibitor [Triticum dicoccoides]
MMRHWQAPSCLLVLLFVLVSSEASTLEDTCKSVGASKKDIGYDYCIKFFQGDSASATADRHGLVVIATKITRGEAANTRKRIDALKASVTDKKVSGCLSDCRMHYTAALKWLEAAAEGVKSGNLQDAKTNLTAVILGTDTCEERFRELGVVSPLAAEDAEFSKGCSIALAITTML